MPAKNELEYAASDVADRALDGQRPHASFCTVAATHNLLINGHDGEMPPAKFLAPLCAAAAVSQVGGLPAVLLPRPEPSTPKTVTTKKRRSEGDLQTSFTGGSAPHTSLSGPEGGTACNEADECSESSQFTFDGSNDSSLSAYLSVRGGGGYWSTGRVAGLHSDLSLSSGKASLLQLAVEGARYPKRRQSNPQQGQQAEDDQSLSFNNDHFLRWSLPERLSKQRWM